MYTARQERFDTLCDTEAQTHLKTTIQTLLSVTTQQTWEKRGKDEGKLGHYWQQLQLEKWGRWGQALPNYTSCSYPACMGKVICSIVCFCRRPYKNRHLGILASGQCYHNLKINGKKTLQLFVSKHLIRAATDASALQWQTSCSVCRVCALESSTWQRSIQLKCTTYRQVHYFYTQPLSIHVLCTSLGHTYLISCFLDR